MKSTTSLTGLAALFTVWFSSAALAQTLFFDDFEDRVADQATIGNLWTWYEQTFPDDQCLGEPTGFGPYDDGDPSDYEVENRNSQTVGQDGSYYRAGLEVPAWADDAGNPVNLDNMLRVYGNQNNPATTCERVLVFQEKVLFQAGTLSFSFDVAQDRDGAPANGERTGAFIKVLRSSDNSFATLKFETLDTNPPAATTPEDASTVSRAINFEVPPEYVGELLQFGFFNDVVENLGQSWTQSAALYDNVMLAPAGIGPAHSGSWYNPDQSGHGFSIEFGYFVDGTPYSVVYWYTYDSAGNPIFMIGQGVPVGDRLEVAFQSPVGMKFGEFNPASVTREDGGTAVFEFSDRDNAVNSYTPSDFSVDEWGHLDAIESLPLIKLFGVPADTIFRTQQ